MWKKIGKLLLKAGKWALGNPEDLIAIIDALSKKEQKKK